MRQYSVLRAQRQPIWSKLSGARPRYPIVDQYLLPNRLEINSWESFARWYRQTIDAMVADKDQLRRRSYWSAALATGDAEWLEAQARGLGLSRFEIREAPPPLQDEESVGTSFLGWQQY